MSEEKSTQNSKQSRRNTKLSSGAKLAIIVVICLVVFVCVLAITYGIRKAEQERKERESSQTIEGPDGPCGMPCIKAEKPMIYLYPEKKTEVTVKLGNPQNLTITYPKYDTGWRVTAEPGGKLLGQDGREYYGLYWEGKSASYHENDEGFVVKGEDTAQFLEDKLAILGLTEREAEEFIVYWLPKMEHNEYNYIRFATDSEIALNMPMEVTPKPDTTIRIMMLTKKLEEPKKIREQQLKSAERKGFTVVEWGGVDLGLQSIK